MRFCHASAAPLNKVKRQVNKLKWSTQKFGQTNKAKYQILPNPRLRIANPPLDYGS